MTGAAGSGGRGGRTWPFYAIGLIVAVGATVAGVLIAATHPSSHRHQHGPVFVVVFTVVAAVVVGAGVMWSIRRQLNRPAMQRLREFSFAQRRQALRALNSGRPLTEEQRRIARAQSDQLDAAATRMRWALPTAVIAFLVLAVGNVGGLRWLWTALTALETVCVVAAVLLLRRQRRRLDDVLGGPSA